MRQGASRSRLGNSEAANGLMLVSPTALYALMLLAAPLAAVLIYSLMVDSKIGASAGFTFGNYVDVWSGKIYQAIMVRSLWVASCVTLITVLLAYPVAYFVSVHVAPERKSLWLFLITIPFWTSYLIRVFLWKVILGYNGVVNSGLLS
ncbi:MAG: ABC transporter permease, partial [Gemmobacter sp.]|nr:ABC transporter permease [Gemmobacter sp.]